MLKEQKKYLIQYLTGIPRDELLCFLLHYDFNYTEIQEITGICRRKASKYDQAVQDRIYHILNHDEIIASLQAIFCDL